MTKQTVINILAALPEEFELDDLIEKLLFVERIEQGLQQLDKGETKSHSQVKNNLKSL